MDNVKSAEGLQARELAWRRMNGRHQPFGDEDCVAWMKSEPDHDALVRLSDQPARVRSEIETVDCVSGGELLSFADVRNELIERLGKLGLVSARSWALGQ
jgi:hypothetical protein